MLLVASTAGLGGGNFASSMANISFFYPDRVKGWALGLNAAGGNIGVSGVQLLTPILISVGLINLYQASPVAGVVSAERRPDVGAAADCRDIRRGPVHEQPDLGKSSFKDQLAIVKRKHTWIMACHLCRHLRLLHRLLRRVPAADQDAISGGDDCDRVPRPAGRLDLSRPFGGLLADKVGGAIVTFWNFVAMAAATIGVLYFVGVKDFTGFLVMFLILFVTTGIGNGSAYRMIPSIFREENIRKAQG